MTELSVLGLNERELEALHRVGIVKVESLAKIDCRSLRLGTDLSILPLSRLACMIQKARWILEPLPEIRVPTKTKLQQLKKKLVEFYLNVAELLFDGSGVLVDYERKEAYWVEEESLRKMRKLEEALRGGKQRQIRPQEAAEKGATARYKLRKRLLAFDKEASIADRRKLYEELWECDSYTTIKDTFYSLEERGIELRYDIPQLDDDVEAVLREEEQTMTGNLIVKLDDYWVEVGSCSMDLEDKIASIESLHPPDYVIKNVDSLLTAPNHDRLTLI